jgi:general secretion pathway protein G
MMKTAGRRCFPPPRLVYRRDAFQPGASAKELARQRIPDVPAVTAFRRWMVVLLLCLGTALAISATAYICAWANYRNLNVHGSAYFTKVDLELLRQEIEAYKQATGKWPARLTDLKVVKEHGVHLDDAGNPVDSWGRPLHYQVEAGGYTLFSYGRDGKPGGFGPDADLYAGQAPSEPERPTLWQFTRSQDAAPALVASIAAGVVAFPIFLLNARGREGNRPSLARVLLANAVTALFAVLAAVMMSALHVMPGGH